MPSCSFKKLKGLYEAIYSNVGYLSIGDKALSVIAMPKTILSLFVKGYLKKIPVSSPGSIAVIGE
jgi:hypothetical protein